MPFRSAVQKDTFPTEKLQIFHGLPGFLGDQIQGSGVQFMKENKRHKDCKERLHFLRTQ